MDKVRVVKLGKTIETDGETSLVTIGDMPPGCMVLFVSMDTWEEIKDDVEVN